MTKIIEEQVKMGPQYLATRVMFGGKRPSYPEEITSELSKSQDEDFKKRLHSSYLGIPVEQAKDARKYLLAQLHLHRHANEGTIERLRIGDTRGPAPLPPAAAGGSGEQRHVTEASKGDKDSS